MFRAMYNERVTITKETKRESDGELSGSSWDNYATNVPMRFVPISATRRSTVIGKFPEATHRAYYEDDNDIHVIPKMRIRRTMPNIKVRTYAILGIFEKIIGDRVRYKEAYIKEVPTRDVGIGE